MDAPKTATGPVVNEAQIEEFRKGPIWARIQWLLKERRNLINMTIVESEGVAVYRAQGAFKENKWLELMPDLMLEQLKQRRKEEAKTDAQNRDG